MNNDNEMSDPIFAVMGVDNSSPVERPNIDNIHVIFWKKAGIIIPWHPDYSAKQAILEWANRENEKDESI